MALSSVLLHWRYAWLVLASFLAGVMNAMAGGGSFLSFPAMLGMGVPPIEANATNTVALWPGQLTSLLKLQADVRRELLPTVLLASLLGGVCGALTLLRTGQALFLHLIPWLLLTGALLFWASAPVSRWMRARSRALHMETQREPALPRLPIFLALLPVCFYIGYFGAGGGFLIMTVLAIFGLDDMHALNAMKVVAACASNLCAIGTFILSGAVLWHFCLLSMVFAATGGYVGAHFARRSNPALLRSVVIGTGLTIAAYFFWRQRGL